MSHSKTSFQKKWLNERDSNGQLYSLCCRPCSDSNYDARSIVCPNAKICVVNNGIAALKQHFQGKKHKSLASLLCKDEKPLGKLCKHL